MPGDGHIYALRNRIERCFIKKKNWRRLDTSYRKAADSYLGVVFIAASAYGHTDSPIRIGVHSIGSAAARHPLPAVAIPVCPTHPWALSLAQRQLALTAASGDSFTSPMLPETQSNERHIIAYPPGLQ